MYCNLSSVEFMKLRNILITFVAIAALLFACEEAAEFTESIVRQETTTCKKVEFEFSEVINQEDEFLVLVNAPLAPIVEEGITYRWDITETNDGVTNTEVDVVGSDQSFSRVLVVGTSQYCLTAFSENCPEGAQVCKNIVVNQEQFNAAKAESVQQINIVATSDGNYTIDVVGSGSSCEAVSFDLSIIESFDNTFFIGLTAPLPSEIGLDRVFYKWNVTKTFEGQTFVTEDLAGGDNATSFDLTAGTFEFCLTTKHLGCEEGAVACKVLVITEEQISDINTNPSTIEKIEVVASTEGTFTIDVIKN